VSTPDRLRALPLRTRLVAGFAAAMLVLLTAAGAVVYWRVQYALDRGLDSELGSAASVIAPLVGADGTVTSPAAANATGTGWQVLAADGSVLDAGGPAPTHPLVRARDLPRTGSRTLDVGSMLPIAAAPYRVEVTALGPSAGDVAAYVLVGVRRDHRDEALRELLLQMSLAGVGALLVASLVGDQLARLALRPVERYRRRAEEIATGSGHRRLEVPTRRDDEVTRLGHTLNEMLAALEESFERQERFVHEASHELRTPLTLLRSRIQLARRRERSVAEHEAVLDELAVDVDRLAALAEQLLELDRASSASDPADRTDLGVVAAAEVARWRSAHPDRADDVVLDEAGARVHAAAGRQVLERIVTNLLTNALVHGGAPVRIVVRRDGAHAVLQVVDDGPGMAPEVLARATRRFSRAPEARARPGAGLGLALVEHLVVRAGGELRLCHAGHHTSTGVVSDVTCGHDDRMTATVLLPVAHPG
jgi:signal transduction histidine kinase